MSLLPFFIPGTTTTINTHQVNAVNFDGSTDLSESSPSTISNSPTFSFSCWLKANSSMDSTGTYGIFRLQTSSSTEVIDIFKTTTSGGLHRITVRMTDTLGFVESFSSDSFTNVLQSSDGWINLLVCGDISDGSNCFMYINNTEIGLTKSTLSSSNIDFSSLDNIIVGKRISSYYHGDVSELWFDPSTYIDFSVESNRRKFITSIGNPVNVGSSGQNPTGSSPYIFLSGDTATWHTNKGTGGGFTENGTLTTASTSPSD